MKIKKYFCAVTAALTLLAGCGSSTYERDTSAGEIKEITLSQMDTMFTQGKRFMRSCSFTYERLF